MRLGVFLFLAMVYPAVADLTPFVLPWNDASSGPTDLADRNRTIDQGSRVSIDAAGHFRTAAEGRRVRFLGVNLAGDSPFTPTNNADGVAGRLAKFGINAVRLHHIDAPWAVGGGIIHYTSSSSRSLQAAQLEHLHFLVSRLRAHGIYVDVNLLTGREFRSGDGLGPEIGRLDPKDQHVLAFFNDVALDRQKEFATELLTPTNRFTGLPLATDPAVAFVEVLNENGILQKWYEGALDRLPAPYSDQLRARWNDWLAARYPDLTALESAWQAIHQPLGANLVRNGAFSSGVANWVLEQHSGALATAARVTEPDGTGALRVVVTRTGLEGWHVQLNQPGLPVQGGQLYTLSFSARADGAARLESSVMMAHDPWQTLGFLDSFDLTQEWQTFTRTFVASAADSNARVNFGGLGTRLGSAWFADVRLQAGGDVGRLPDGATLAARNLPVLVFTGDGFSGTDDARRDWIRFLISLEDRYYDAMVGHLRARIGYPGLVFGTIMANSPAAVQSRLDVIDAHAYWQHPQFPGTPWDPNNWTVANASMLNTSPSETTLAALARQRLTGKPFTVTEYQHPSPNPYGAEGPILLAAYGALQDWDGLWFFDYGWGNDSPVGGDSHPMGKYRGYFDTGQHPAKMANVLIAANLFRRGDVAPALHEEAVTLNAATELDLLLRRSGAWSVFSSAALGVPGALAMVSRISVDYEPGGAESGQAPAAPAATLSDTGQLHWFASNPAGYLTVDTPRTVGAVGFLAGRLLTLGGVEFQVLSNELGWATVALTRTDEGTLQDSGRAVLVATGRCENSGQQWKDAKHNSLTSWGGAPTLIETVPLRVRFPQAATRLRAWVLDPRGQRGKAATIEAGSEGRGVLVTRPGDGTLWYEIEVTPAPSASFEAWRSDQFTPAELGAPDVSGPGADPAGDGVPNLVKYALGLDARVPALKPDLLQWGVDSEGNSRVLWLTYTRNKAAEDVAIVPYFGAEVADWTEAPETVIADLGKRERVRTEHAIPAGAPALGLMRVEVRRP